MKFKKWIPGVMLGTMMAVMTSVPVMADNINSGSTPPDRIEGTEKVDNTVYIWYNASIKYRRCFYDRTTAEIGAKSIHGNI